MNSNLSSSPIPSMVSNHNLSQLGKSSSRLIFGVILFVLIIGGIGLFYPKMQPVIKKPSTGQEKKENIESKPLLIPLADFPADLQKGLFTCPVKSTFCKNKYAFNESSMSATLNNGSPIYAAFDGEVEVFPSFHPLSTNKNEAFIEIILLSRTRGLMADYYFKGTPTVPNEAKEGGQIGISNGQPIEFMGNNQFIFKLSKVTASGYQLMNLSMGDFK